MKTYSDTDLIALGLQIQQARSKGGKTILEKFGKEHFSELGKLSALKKKSMKYTDSTPQTQESEATDKLDNTTSKA
jgi:uncharacterized LabA/DUF88 family protein